MEECSQFCEIKKSKRSKRRDRISELPRSLILEILSYLLLEDVLKTTVLSKHWKDLWNTLPYLYFNAGDRDCVTFQNIVNRTLVLWKGTKILEFEVNFLYEPSASSDLDLWLRFAIENRVEDLDVNLIGDWDKRNGFIDTNYSASQRLYSCSSLRKLALKGCNLKVPGNAVHWVGLRCLTIDGVCLRKHAIEKVLDGAPQLEVLILRVLENYESLSIHSNSLKKLIVERYLFDFEDDERVDTVLKIRAPKVETLELLGVLYYKWMLLDISSLSNATVVFETPKHANNGRFSGFQLVEDILGQVYRSKRRVEQVTLPCLCFDKVLKKMMKKDMVAPLSYAKFLKVYLNDAPLFKILECFPKLTTLEIGGRDPSRFHYHSDIFDIRCDIGKTFGAESSETDFTELCLPHLMNVKIDWRYCESHTVFPIIEFLLKHCNKLEKLVLRVGSMQHDVKLSTATKLLKLPRSSPNAEVVLS